VKPMAAALTGALISGVGMYVVGTHAQDRLVGNPAYVQTVDGQWAQVAQPGLRLRWPVRDKGEPGLGHLPHYRHHRLHDGNVERPVRGSVW